ncbi:hypothetical protein BABINDRAFT_160931 [Babjeviella inositovora NRRL Y-12698]|uniref:Glycosylphosphatidylinositol anchor biosynthesis protein 11 n=1 Tax=Babjeviella inositovora NRRL Y-12698 TaxID=984486 RepID=A0A1E3QSS8_9ASCO|nr:uncharacterized protein BABINDRAFT_160931 [Babjeviella inositovora NRRL Y-12698]ODQ80698.1 hypothetical protein BABINDRAFT_160931 [Babjeviella inositovora NRRL Y-12698]
MARKPVVKKLVSFLDVILEAPHPPTLEPPSETSRSLLNVPIHALLLIWSYFSFGLTRDVAGTMARMIPNLILLQIGYAYVLLSKGKTKRTKKKGRGNDNVLIYASLFVALVASIPIFSVLVLFGSPLYDHLKETYLLALHLSFLIIYPLLVVYQYDLEVWFNLATFNVDSLAQNPVYVSSVAAFVGAWLGVFPIPLDWDRPWQAWPITLLVGSYLGYFVGGVVHYFL